MPAAEQPCENNLQEGQSSHCNMVATRIHTMIGSEKTTPDGVDAHVEETIQSVDGKLHRGEADGLQMWTHHAWRTYKYFCKFAERQTG